MRVFFPIYLGKMPGVKTIPSVCWISAQWLPDRRDGVSCTQRSAEAAWPMLKHQCWNNWGFQNSREKDTELYTIHLRVLQREDIRGTPHALYSMDKSNTCNMPSHKDKLFMIINGITTRVWYCFFWKNTEFHHVQTHWFYRKTSVQVQTEKQNRSILRYEMPVPNGGAFRSLVFLIVSDSSLRHSLTAP